MVGQGDDHRRREISPETVFRCMISCISAIVTQLSLLLIPSFFPSLSLFFLLLLSGSAFSLLICFDFWMITSLIEVFLVDFAAMVVVLAIGSVQYCRRLLGVRASAPASVFLHIIFIWAVYLGVIREGLV